MIVPSIDLMDGRAVQLVGGRELELDAGDPWPLAERFARVGIVSIVDLDAALGRGSNRALIESLCKRFPCRVGGGLRDFESARRALDAGAREIVLGTAAEPELLARLPRERLVVALDAVHDEVVVDGWRKRTGQDVVERMRALAPLAAGFLVTFVEREGRLGGTRLEPVPELVRAAGDARLTVAGGVTTATEVAQLDRMGADAQVGMALYTGRLSLGAALLAPVTSDRSDGLVPTVVVDEADRALGLAYSNGKSLSLALEEGRGIYWSRKRGLWRKGDSSGAGQELLEVALDCDRDTLRFRVRQEEPGFCHLATRSCWGEQAGLPALLERLQRGARLGFAAGSYTQRLLDDRELLAAKLREEAQELGQAATADEVVHEAADLLYFASAALARAGVPLADVERALDARALRITRRPGDAKPAMDRGQA